MMEGSSGVPVGNMWVSKVPDADRAEHCDQSLVLLPSILQL
jgi:hypothetical protein